MEAPGSPTTVRIRLLYFAALRELSGCREELLAVPREVAHLPAFSSWLEQERPALTGQLGQIRYAIDGELVNGGSVLSDGAELALLPPFAGG